MADSDNDNEDIRKIHNEINQIVNQRYLITTAAITIFGVFVNMFFPRDKFIPNGEIGGLIYTGIILFLTLLLLLFIYSIFLKVMLRTFTTYLSISEKSQWEVKWKKYRDSGYFGYSKAQSIIFIFLGLIAFLYPFGLSYGFNLSLKPNCGFILLIIFGLIYFLLLIGVGFFNLFDNEKKSEEKWKNIDEINPK